MSQEKFRQPRKPLTPEELEQKHVEEPKTNIPKPNASMPPQLQAMLQKAAAAQHQQQQNLAIPEYHPGPRLAFTGNAKLDELLAGLKETVYKYEEIVLPSMGKFYNGQNGPPDGVLHIRLMTGEEEQILSTQRFVKKGQAIDMIYKNCIRETYSPENFLTIDRAWLLIYLRGISYTPNYEVEVTCTECDKKFQTTIDLDSQITIRRCPDDFGPANLTDTLPKTGYKITYRLSTGRDDMMVENYREKMSQKADNSLDDTWGYRASLLISEIEGLTEQNAIKILISKLPIQDVAYIRSLLTDPPFGLNTKVEIVCPYCTEVFQVEMPMDVGFFSPAVRKENQTQA